MAPASSQSKNQPSTKDLLEGQLVIWHNAFGFVKSMALKCAMDLSIPDAISSRGGAITLPDLLAATKLPPAKLPFLRRLMRVLTMSGIFGVQQLAASNRAKKEDDAVYTLTTASRLLVSGENNEGSLTLLPCMYHVVGQTSVSTFFDMHAWFADDNADVSLCEKAHGKGLWEMIKTSAADNVVFNEALVADTRLVMHVVLRDCPGIFRGITSLVDVGGGYGSAAVAVVTAFPHIKCTVLDLPQVVAMAPTDGQVSFVAGDFFESIPQADAVFLKTILHDWNDENCVKILRQCKKAIPPKGAGGKVIIIDMVVGSSPQDRSCQETQALTDLFIMSINGIEREEHEWRKIFLEAGFGDYKITPILGLRSIIEVYPREDADQNMSNSVPSSRL